jgi:hypothetical protein
MPRAVQATGHVNKRGLARLRASYSHPADDDEKRYDKGGNLLIQTIGGSANGKRRKVDTPYDRTAQADTNSELHFVLLGHRHGSYELGGICLRHESSVGPGGSASYTHDNGNNNKTNERLWDVEPICCLLNRFNH